MKPLVAALLILVVVAPVTAQSIGSTTLAELAQMPREFHEGLFAGVLMALENGGMSCPRPVTAEVLKADVWARVKAGEIARSSGVYAAVTHAARQAGCLFIPTRAAGVRSHV